MPDVIEHFDFAVLDWIQASVRNTALDRIIPLLTSLGNAGILWIALTLICLSVRRWRKCGITMAAALIAGLLVGNLLLKLLIARDRPCWISPPEIMLIPIPRDYSFPSCHTLSSFGASVTLLHHSKRAGIPAVIVAGIIALTRLYLYVHFPSDVIAGMLLGMMIAAAACMFTDRCLWTVLSQRFPKLFVEKAKDM